VLCFVSVSFGPGPLRVFKASSWSCHPIQQVLYSYGMHVMKTVCFKSADFKRMS